MSRELDMIEAILEKTEKIIQEYYSTKTPEKGKRKLRNKRGIDFRRLMGFIRLKDRHNLLGLGYLVRRELISLSRQETRNEELMVKLKELLELIKPAECNLIEDAFTNTSGRR